ncbi:MAG: GNAT family N-acetyltransferase [Anaerolineae bacterium]
MIETDLQDIEIHTDLRPGNIGEIIALHGKLYAAAYGWDATFEAYVAEPLAQFAKRQGYRERLWIVKHRGHVAGSIAIVEASPFDAQLRWFLLHPDLRGRGLGRKLITDAIAFCRSRGYTSIHLWTAGRLTSAIRLYQSVGFILTEEVLHELWGDLIREQRYDLRL